MTDPATTIFLNHATASDLQKLDGIGQGDIQILLAGRPYRGWDDVQRAGLSDESLKALQRAGVDFGAPSSGPIVEPGSGGSGGSPGGNLGRA
jgi:hypothetical protein